MPDISVRLRPHNGKRQFRERELPFRGYNRGVILFSEEYIYTKMGI